MKETSQEDIICVCEPEKESVERRCVRDKGLVDETETKLKSEKERTIWRGSKDCETKCKKRGKKTEVK